MKVLKFGGKSLSNGEGINKVISIIENKVNQGEEIAVVVSARGNATDELEAILGIAAKNGDYKTPFESFKKNKTENMAILICLQNLKFWTNFLKE